MKHAREIIELMSAFPGRDFRIRDIIRYVNRGVCTSERERHATRIAVSRALGALADAGCVLIRPSRAARGGYSHYRWRSLK